MYPFILFGRETLHAIITQSAATLISHRTGIRVDIPEQSLSSEEETVDLVIRPCFNGPFELPPDYESASPAYLIRRSRKVTFLKEITIIIHHYSSLKNEKDCEEMVFFSANSTPQYINNNPTYRFKHIRGSKGKFKSKSQIGEIQLKHFCLIKIGRKRNRVQKTGAAKKKKGI